MPALNIGQSTLLIFTDQAGKLFFLRVSPVEKVSVRAEPMNLGVRVELLLTQNRMGTTKGDHATAEVVHLLVPFQAG